jgi:protein-L-isoaspartate(D-aspartate) O-methyltransferase
MWAGACRHRPVLGFSAVVQRRYAQGMSSDMLLAAAQSWRVGGSNNDELVDSLIQSNFITNDDVERSMRRVDRGAFVPATVAEPFANAAPSLGFNANMSTPVMHAQLLEYLRPALQAPSAERTAVLDVGCGSGYLTAVIAVLAGAAEGSTSSGGGAFVHGVDSIGGIVTDAAANFKRAGLEALLLQESDGNNGPAAGCGVLLEAGDVLSDEFLGRVPDGCYDVIHAGASFATVDALLPLLKKLKAGGVCIAPVGAPGQEHQLLRLEAPAGGDAAGAVRSATALMPTAVQPAQAAEDQTGGGSVGALETRTREERKAAAQAALVEWQAAFLARTGARASREDMARDEAAAALFREFAKLNK